MLKLIFYNIKQCSKIVLVCLKLVDALEKARMGSLLNYFCLLALVVVRHGCCDVKAELGPVFHSPCYLLGNQSPVLAFATSLFLCLVKLIIY